jgi:hypothetical protein
MHELRASWLLLPSFAGVTAEILILLDFPCACAQVNQSSDERANLDHQNNFRRRFGAKPEGPDLVDLQAEKLSKAKQHSQREFLMLDKGLIRHALPSGHGSKLVGAVQSGTPFRTLKTVAQE